MKRFIFCAPYIRPECGLNGSITHFRAVALSLSLPRANLHFMDRSENGVLQLSHMYLNPTEYR